MSNSTISNNGEDTSCNLNILTDAMFNIINVKRDTPEDTVTEMLRIAVEALVDIEEDAEPSHKTLDV
jgi:hypothetical protein